MKYIFGFLFTANLLANPLSDSAINDAKDYEPLLPSTLVVKDGEIVGSISEQISSQEQAQKIIESGNLPQEVKKIDESKNDHLKDSSTDSYYFYYTYGAYYNPNNYYYGYHYGAYHYTYNRYYAWNGYSFYRYSNNYYYRRPASSYYYYWW